MSIGAFAELYERHGDRCRDCRPVLPCPIPIGECGHSDFLKSKLTPRLPETSLTKGVDIHHDDDLTQSLIALSELRDFLKAKEEVSMSTYSELEYECAAIRRRERRKAARHNGLIVAGFAAVVGFLLTIGLCLTIYWLSTRGTDSTPPAVHSGIDQRATDANSGWPARVMEVGR